MIDTIRQNIQLEMRLLVADSLDLIAETQYEAEPEALYSGVEVAIALKEYAQAVRDGNEKNTGVRDS